MQIPSTYLMHKVRDYIVVVPVQLGAVKLYVASSNSGGAQEKGKTG
jgi:hypothetical protein